MPEPVSKVFENRVMRMAARQRLRLHRICRKDRLAADYGLYQLIDGNGNVVLSGDL